VSACGMGAATDGEHAGCGWRARVGWGRPASDGGACKAAAGESWQRLYPMGWRRQRTQNGETGERWRRKAQAGRDCSARWAGGLACLMG